MESNTPSYECLLQSMIYVVSMVLHGHMTNDCVARISLTFTTHTHMQRCMYILTHMHVHIAYDNRYQLTRVL